MGVATTGPSLRGASFISAAVALSVLTACGGGGGGGSGALPRTAGAGALVPAPLVLVSANPPADALAVSVSATLRFGFDGVVRAESLDGQRSTLRDVDNDRYETVDFVVTDGGSTVTLQPQQELRHGTLYEVVLAGDVHATDGRFLESDHRLRFRTAATAGPSVSGVEPAPPGALPAGRPFVRLTLDGPVDPNTLAGTSVEFVQADLRIPGEVFLDRITAAAELTDVLVIRPTAPLSGSAPVDLFVGALQAAGGSAGSPQVPVRWNVAPTSELRTISRVEPAGALARDAGLVLHVATPVDRESLVPALFEFSMSGSAPGPVDVDLSADGHRLFVNPSGYLVPGATFLLRVRAGAFRYRGGTPNDPWIHTQVVGSDNVAPQLAAIEPAAGETDAPPNLRFRVTHDEPVVLPSLDRCDLQVDSGGGFAPWPLASAVVGETSRQLIVQPDGDLPLGARYRFSIARAPDSVRDAEGNPAEDLEVFGRVADEGFPELVPQAGGSLTSLPTDSAIVLRATRPLGRSSFPSSIVVTDDRSQPVAAQITLSADDRTIRIAPVGAWTPAAAHNVQIVAGSDGLRAADGAWLGETITLPFRAFPSVVRTPMTTLQIEALPSWQADEPRVPSQNVQFVASVDRGLGGPLDPTTVRIDLAREGVLMEQLDIRDLVLLDERLTLRLGSGVELEHGSWTATLHASSLTGIAAAPTVSPFRVVPASASQVPLERVQIVAVLFELDRDQNGFADFREDMVRLGLATGHSSTGLDMEMERLLRDGILSRAHTLYQRTPDGARLDDGSSVPIRFVDGRPRGVVAMEIACGGLDPEGLPGRVAGDPSSGTLGRAFFDERNSKPTENATAMSPGLGVFPGEVFLYETRIANALGSGLRTGFSDAFAPLSPAFGGDPLGTDPDDAVVLDPDFDYAEATSRQRARYLVLMGAADQWATVIGTILAHEIGHCLGLTEPGEHPVGLHGDESLHNAESAPTDVMSATLGYDAMVRLDFSFRELNLAYLLHRVVIE